MAAVPTKVAARIAAGLKRFQPIVASAKARDVNESDTVVIVADILQEVFGYDKYSEITSEHLIRGTYCDLAVKVDGTLAFLVEVKAIGLELKESFVKQAVDYAANQGIEWVVLTNSITWRAFRIGFAKPISNELVLDLSLATVNPRNQADIDLAFLLSKEGWQRSKIGEYHSQKEALSRFSIAALLMSDTVTDVVRRELRRMSPGVRVEIDDVRAVLENEVLKRDVLEGERATLAKRLVTRASGKMLRQSRPSGGGGPRPDGTDEAGPVAVSAPS
jgi:predicted type IV restriction endonuclease